MEREEVVLVASRGDGVAEDFTASGFGSEVSTDNAVFVEGAAGVAFVESLGDAGAGTCCESVEGTGRVAEPAVSAAFDAPGSEEEVVGVRLIGGALETEAAASAMAAVSEANEEAVDCCEDCVPNSESAALVRPTAITIRKSQRKPFASFEIG